MKIMVKNEFIFYKNTSLILLVDMRTLLVDDLVNLM